MEELIIYAIKVIHVLVSILLIIVVLLQPGKSGDLGSVFGGGGGSSESVFGASGAVPFLSKVTRVLAVLFLLSSLALGYYATRDVNSSIVTDVPAAQQTDLTPVTDVTEPAKTEQQADNPEEAAPSEVSQESGNAPSQESEAQMSSEPDSSGSQEAAPENTEETQ